MYRRALAPRRVFSPRVALGQQAILGQSINVLRYQGPSDQGKVVIETKYDDTARQVVEQRQAHGIGVGEVLVSEAA